MKPIRSISLVLFSLLAFSPGCAGGAIRDRDPGKALADMNALSAPSTAISRDMLAYVQAIAHVKDPAVVEGRRREMIRSVETAILRANQVAPYNGDERYKDSVLDFLNTMYSILRNDYARLVNMEEIAEESYDAMEAYLLAKKRAGEKLEAAAERLKEAEKQFAADYNIQLIANESDNDRKLKQAMAALEYQGEVFLVHFKSYKQELYLIQALDRNDLSAVEQNRRTLLSYAEEGLRDLANIQPHNGDASLRVACENTLQFYREEADRLIPLQLEFLLKKEQFESLKRNFDALRPEDRTREAVGEYNRLVSEMNALGGRYNQINAELNQRRGRLVNQWNATNETFLSRHIPR
jgi:hypothetical protein